MLSFLSANRRILAVATGLVGSLLVLLGLVFSNGFVFVAGAGLFVAYGYFVVAMIMSLVRDLGEKSDRLAKMIVEAGKPVENSSRQLAKLHTKSEQIERLAAKTNNTLDARFDELDDRTDRIRRTIGQGKKHQDKATLEIVQSIDAIIQMRSLLEPAAPTPLFGGWAMDSTSVLWLVGEIARSRPRLVVECGSGASSLWLAKALKQVGSGRLLALEHLAEHQQKSNKPLVEHGLADIAEIALAPLQALMIDDKRYNWYGLEGVTLRPGSIDMLVVDGPPGATGPLARYPALHVLEPFLADGALIILDDTSRADEAEVARRWISEFNLDALGPVGGMKGTTVFRYRYPDTEEDDEEELGADMEEEYALQFAS